MKRAAIVAMALGLGMPSIGACQQVDALRFNPKLPDWTIVNRCSHAAALAVFAAETFPTDRGKRQEFVFGILPKLPEKLEEQAPGIAEAMAANTAVTTLIEQGQDPKVSQNRDWLMAQAAATCALGVMRPEAK